MAGGGGFSNPEGDEGYYREDDPGSGRAPRGGTSLIGGPGRLVAGALAVAAALFVVPCARAGEIDTAVRESYATNEAMLTQATTAAVSKLFLGFNVPPGSSLRVEPATDHKANWFVEAHLLAFLSEAGYQAYLAKLSEPANRAAGAAGDSAAEAARDTVEAAAGDSAATVDASRTVSAVGEPLEAPSAPEPDYVLRYRVVLCELSYPEKYRTSPLGASKVQRRASVSLQAQVLWGKREDVVWVGRGSVERVNLVPAGKLDLVAGTNFPFNPPALESKSMSSYVEPVLVTGIVAGLIYLFYANQD